MKKSNKKSINEYNIHTESDGEEEGGWGGVCGGVTQEQNDSKYSLCCRTKSAVMFQYNTGVPSLQEYTKLDWHWRYWGVLAETRWINLRLKYTEHCGCANVLSASRLESQVSFNWKHSEYRCPQRLKSPQETGSPWIGGEFNAVNLTDESATACWLISPSAPPPCAHSRILFFNPDHSVKGTAGILQLNTHKVHLLSVDIHFCVEISQ